MIRFHEVSKHYGAHVALDAFALQVAPGEIVALLGNNGAGKTTAIRLLAGVIAPDRGRITLAGHEVRREARAARSALGIVPDGASLPPRLTARECLALFGRLHGMQAAAIARAGELLIESLGFAALRERRVGTLSLGERMQVALACALVHAPSCLVLDEPTRGLDIRHVARLRAVLRAQRAAGTAILFSSHVMQEVGALADRIAILEGGRLCFEGAPAALAGDAGLESGFLEVTAHARELAA